MLFSLKITVPFTASEIFIFYFPWIRLSAHLSPDGDNYDDLDYDNDHENIMNKCLNFLLFKQIVTF